MAQVASADVEALLPERFQVLKHLSGGRQGFRVSPHHLLASPLGLAHQSGLLQDSNVLLHPGEGHVITPGEGRDRVIGDQCPPDHVPAGGVSEGGKNEVRDTLLLV